MITSLAEKKGGMQKTKVYMEAFGDLIVELHLVDLPEINGVGGEEATRSPHAQTYI